MVARAVVPHEKCDMIGWNPNEFSYITIVNIIVNFLKRTTGLIRLLWSGGLCESPLTLPTHLLCSSRIPQRIDLLFEVKPPHKSLWTGK